MSNGIVTFSKTNEIMLTQYLCQTGYSYLFTGNNREYSRMYNIKNAIGILKQPEPIQNSNNNEKRGGFVLNIISAIVDFIKIAPTPPNEFLGIVRFLDSGWKIDVYGNNNVAPAMELAKKIAEELGVNINVELVGKVPIFELFNPNDAWRYR